MKRLLHVLALAALTLAPATVALAHPGTWDDPAGDTHSTGQTGKDGGPFDVIELAHSDTKDDVTYNVRTKASFTASDLDKIQFILIPRGIEAKTLGDPNYYVFARGGNSLTGTFEACREQEDPPDTMTCEVLAKLKVTQPDAKELKVVWPLEVLRDEGFKEDRYQYEAVANDPSGLQDEVPGDADNGTPRYITHVLGQPEPPATAKPTPVPTERAATAAATDAAEPEPTPRAVVAIDIPQPTPTPTPEVVDANAAGFEPPREEPRAGGTGRVVAIAATSAVVAGGALAAWRLFFAG